MSQPPLFSIRAWRLLYMVVADLPCLNVLDFERLLSIEGSYFLSNDINSWHLLKALQDIDRLMLSNNDLLDWLFLAISLVTSLILGVNGVYYFFLFSKYFSHFYFLSISYCENLSKTLLLRFFFSFFFYHQAWLTGWRSGFSKYNELLCSNSYNFFFWIFSNLLMFLFCNSSILLSNYYLVSFGYFFFFSSIIRWLSSS